jgi:RNase P subunit RPR2
MSRSYCHHCKKVGINKTFPDFRSRVRHEKKCVNAEKPPLILIGDQIRQASKEPRWPYFEIACQHCGHAIEVLIMGDHATLKTNVRVGSIAKEQF